MKFRIYIIAFLLTGVNSVHAQQLFISKATIEYEVKVNIQKTMGNSNWAEMLKEAMPQFKTGYYTFTFADNKSIYKFDHWGEKKVPEWLRRSDEENIWYFDHNKDRFNMQKTLYGSNFNVDDSIPAIQWRLTNENRIIAGFNCRKAEGIIMDSVYVFAFYTNEIMITGGPCSINGLPGMVLGLTIPRMYASWIATKVNVNDVNVSAIKPSTSKKMYTRAGLENVLKQRIKEDGSQDDPDQKKWMDQTYWNTIL